MSLLYSLTNARRSVAAQCHFSDGCSHSPGTLFSCSSSRFFFMQAFHGIYFSNADTGTANGSMKEMFSNASRYGLHPPSETPPLSETNQFPSLNSVILPSDFLYSFNIIHTFLTSNITLIMSSPCCNLEDRTSEMRVITHTVTGSMTSHFPFYSIIDIISQLQSL